MILNLLKCKNNDIDENKNKRVNSNNLLKRKNNDFDGNKNKRVNSNNLLKRKYNDIDDNDIDRNNGNVKQAKTSFKGFYISEGCEIIEKTKGTIEYFREILGGNCNISQIGNDYEILYNKKKDNNFNKFLLSNINYATTIKGHIIIYNTKGNKSNLEKIKESLKLNFID